MGKCFSCGIETPLAIRLPGLYSKLPSDKRGRLPYCRDHEADAVARRDRAIGTPAKPAGANRGDTQKRSDARKAGRHGAANGQLDLI